MLPLYMIVGPKKQLWLVTSQSLLLTVPFFMLVRLPDFHDLEFIYGVVLEIRGCNGESMMGIIRLEKWWFDGN